MVQSKFYMESSWAEKLKDEFEQPYMQDLQTFLSSEKEKKSVVYPPENLIFNAFCQTSFDDVKVVIVGQDPYHGSDQAHGLSFSVPPNIKAPPSLKNIYKELVNDVNISYPKTGCLISWAKQGVFLLNSILTVRKAEPMSHHGKGWEVFTDAVIRILNEKQDSIVFLLWGKAAQEKCLKGLTDSKHLILKASHPSFYSVAGFWGCKHFSKTNEFLTKMGKTPIDWNVF